MNMNLTTRWSTTNRLVQRVRRHGALATLFRSPLRVNDKTIHTSSQLVLGRFVEASPEHAQAPAAVERDSSLSSETDVPPIGADMHQEVATGAVVASLRPQTTITQGRLPSLRAPALPKQVVQAAALPSSRTIQVDTAAASPDDPPSASFTPIVTNATPEGSDQIDLDQTWQRLQRIRHMHEQQHKSPQDSPAPVVDIVQHSSVSDVRVSQQRPTPIDSSPSAYVEQPRQIMPAASVTEGGASIDDPVQASKYGHRATQKMGEGADFHIVMSAATPDSIAGNREDPLVSHPPHATPALSMRSVGVPGDHTAVVQTQRIMAKTDAPTSSERLRAPATDPGASAIVGLPMPDAPIASDSRAGEQEAALQLEATAPTAYRDPAHSTGGMEPPVQTATYRPDSISNDSTVVEVVRRQMASIDTGIETESSVDLIAPRRPPPATQKAPTVRTSSSQVLASEHVDGSDVVTENVSLSTEAWPSIPQMAVRAQRVSTTPENSESVPLQRTMVDTDIGALPAELWRVIGVAPPDSGTRTHPSAAHDVTTAAETGSLSASSVATSPRLQSQPKIEVGEAALNLAATQSSTTLSEYSPLQRTTERSSLAPIVNAPASTPYDASLPLLQATFDHHAVRSAPTADDATVFTDTQDVQQLQPGLLNSHHAAVQRMSLVQVVSEMLADESVQKRVPDNVDGASFRSDEAEGLAPAASVRGSLQTVQLMPAIDTALSPTVTFTGTQAAWPEVVAPAGRSSTVDIDDLAQKVYRQLRRRLLIEWERLRPMRD